jgi:hypothetical protein
MTRRNNRTLTSALDESTTETVKDDVAVVENAEDVSETPQNAPEPTEEVAVDQSSTSTLEDLANEIKGVYKERTSKKTVEETHTRTTFLLENTLLKRLNAVSAKKKGLKTLILNKAVKAILDEMDKK